jgi:hypothetical protein
VLLSLFCRNVSAQQLYLKIMGQTERESKFIDSIGYVSNHQNAKSVIDENNNFSGKLIKVGFSENQIIENEKRNDSTFFFRYKLGTKTDFIHIYVGAENELLFDTKKDTLIIPFSESEAFLNTTLKK